MAASPAGKTIAGPRVHASGMKVRVTYTIAAFYRFVSLDDPSSLRNQLRAIFGATDLRGTLLIAPEGINGTMAGSPATIDHLLRVLAETVGLDAAEVKFSLSQNPPFLRQKFQVKAEIIAFRKAKVDPTRAGIYVQPENWNTLLENEDVLLLDTRNRYETDLGTFTGATVPGTETFSDFVTFAREQLDPAKHRKIAMFCTGGIRCEKASAFLLQEGFDEIYHLKGGILKYLEDVPEPQSKWQGACYLFDRRTSVGQADFETPDLETCIGTDRI
jgi:UPF0176 protein